MRKKSKYIPSSQKKKAESKDRLEWCFCSQPTDEIQSISYILLCKKILKQDIEARDMGRCGKMKCRQCQARRVPNNVFPGVGLAF